VNCSQPPCGRTGHPTLFLLQRFCFFVTISVHYLQKKARRGAEEQPNQELFGDYAEMTKTALLDKKQARPDWRMWAYLPGGLWMTIKNKPFSGACPDGGMWAHLKKKGLNRYDKNDEIRQK